LLSKNYDFVEDLFGNEIVAFEILMEVGKVSGKVQTLDFKRTDFRLVQGTDGWDSVEGNSEE